MFATAGVMGGFYAISTLLEGRLQTAVIVGGIVVGYIFEIMLIQALGRRNAELRLAINLFRLIEILEKNPGRWREVGFQALLNRRIERAAIGLETLPYALRLRDVATLATVLGSARRKAAAMRALKIWVAQPNPFTYTDLIWRLSNDLVVVIDGR
jgi:hypothetical protein